MYRRPVARSRFNAKFARALSLLGLLSASDAWAGQIVVDNSFGHAGPLSGNRGQFTIPATLGKSVGPNLFHSFSTFNLDKGETAALTASAATKNIIARVTGGSASNIDGAIATRLDTNPTTPHPANFYLINAAGVVFGPDVTLDVGGSFAVTTADTLKLSGGGHFDAAGSTPGVLTINPPTAFGFLTRSPASIVVQGSSALTTPGGSGFAIVAGGIQIAHANIVTGRAILVGVASPSEVKLDQTGMPLPTVAGGAVAISQSTVSASERISLSGGPVQITNGSLLHTTTTVADVGTIQVNASDLTIDRQNSPLLTGLLAESNVADSRARAGPISVDCNMLKLANGAVIRSVAGEAGQGGNVAVKVTDAVAFSGAAVGDKATAQTAQDNTVGGIDALSLATATGRAGSVSLTAQSLSITGTEGVRSETYGAGNSGSVAINVTGDLSLAAPQASIDASSNAMIMTSPAGKPSITGNAGDVAISAKTLELTSGGMVSSTTNGSGNAGGITVQVVGGILLDGTQGSSTIGANSFATSTGNGGDVAVHSSSLMVLNGAQIECNTDGSGVGGSIRVRSGRVFLDRQHGISNLKTSFTGIAADALGDGTGKGGGVDLKVDSLTLLNGAAVASNSFATGAGGSVRVDARDVMLSGELPRTSPIPSQLAAAQEANHPSKSKSSTGGSVTVHTNSLEIHQGEILTTTNGAGAGGDIKIDVSGLATLDGSGAQQPAISAGSTGSGRGGNIRISVGANLSLTEGGQISSTTTGSGSAGGVTIQVAREMLLDGTDGFSAVLANSSGTSSSGSGGSVAVASGTLMIFNGAQVEANTEGSGEGGSVRIRSGRVLFDRQHEISNLKTGFTGIAADALQGSKGNGGGVDLNVGSLTLLNGAAVASNSSGTGTAGSIRVDARDVLLSGELPRSSPIPSQLGSSTFSKATGGKLSIHAERNLYLLGGGTILARSEGGIGGDIHISAGESVFLKGGAISTNAKANGGSVSIAAPLKIQLSDASQITTNSSTSGDGGNITIDPLELTLSADSAIRANAGGRQSKGGRVAINADATPGAVKGVNVTATGGAPGLSGSITLGTFQTDIAGSLVLLETPLANLPLLLPRCGAQLGIDQSSFISIGRGGAPAQPGGWLPEIQLELTPTERNLSSR